MIFDTISYIFFLHSTACVCCNAIRGSLRHTTRQVPQVSRQGGAEYANHGIPPSLYLVVNHHRHMCVSLLAHQTSTARLSGILQGHKSVQGSSWFYLFCG